MAKVMNSVQRLIAGKKKLISRLEGDIKSEIAYRDEQVEKIKFRIRQATTILAALEKGTLKP